MKERKRRRKERYVLVKDVTFVTGKVIGRMTASIDKSA